MTASIAQLQAFLTLAELGHFSRAAERLALSQSTLSHTIGRLEAALGTRLFTRHTRGCRLSEAGAALLPSARRLVSEWEHMARSAHEMALLGLGSVTVAAPTAQCDLLLPPLMREFAQRMPRVRVRLLDVAEQQIQRLVQDGVADLGLCTRTDTHGDLLATPFYTDNYIAALSPEHPLSRRRSLSWGQLQGQSIVGPLPDNPVRRHLDAQLAARGLALDYHHEVSMPWTMVGLVRENLGVAVLTTALRPLIQWHGLVTRPLAQPTLSRTLVLLRAKGQPLSTAAGLMRDLILNTPSPGRLNASD